MLGVKRATSEPCDNMTIEIYSDPATINCRKVLAGLQQLKAEYNQNYIDYFAGQQKSDEFKKINPCATVPAATDGDLTLTESNAILQYAADVVGDDSMYPKDLKKRANVNRWLLWEASVWVGSCYVCHPAVLCACSRSRNHLDAISQRITNKPWSALMHPFLRAFY